MQNKKFRAMQIKAAAALTAAGLAATPAAAVFAADPGTAVVSTAEDTAVTDAYYTVSQTEDGAKNVSLSAKVSLTGGELKDDQFTFVLTDSDGKEIGTAKNKKDGSVSFDAIPVKDAGTFTYKVSQKAADAADGIARDASIFTATVTSKKQTDENGNETLDVSVSFDKDPVFSNAVQTTSASLAASTAVSGKALAAGDFTFVLYDASGAKLQEKACDANGNAAFDAISYTKAGTYVYTIGEMPGSDKAMLYDGSKYTANVIVTADNAGKLTSAVTYRKNGEDKDSASAFFANVYNTNMSTNNAFSAYAVLNGKTIAADEFTFELKDASGNVVSTAKNKADGSVSFPEIPYTQEGTYKYTISQKAGTETGVTYDATVYNAAVTVERVTKDGKNTLESKVTFDNNAMPVFKNSYVDPKANTASTAITAKVSLTGGTLKANQFTFDLVDSNGKTIQTAKNAADGTVTFKAIDYKKADVYIYHIVQETGKDADITYDLASPRVTVTVTADSTGKLTTKTVYEPAANFTNTAKTATSQNQNQIFFKLSANVDLKGRNLKAGEFTLAVTNKAKIRLQEKTNDANGNVAFDELYVPREEGVYTYTITENKGTEEGITYDTKTVNVSVTVTKTGTNDYKATVSYDVNPTFENTTADAETAETAVTPATVKLTAQTALNGRELRKGDFHFTLTDSNGKTLDTVTNLSDGSVVFQDLQITKAGTYKFYIAEDQESQNGITYDANKAEITVTAAADENGKLTTRVDGNNPVFTNTYKSANENTNSNAGSNNSASNDNASDSSVQNNESAQNQAAIKHSTGDTEHKALVVGLTIVGLGAALLVFMKKFVG